MMVTCIPPLPLYFFPPSPSSSNTLTGALNQSIDCVLWLREPNRGGGGRKSGGGGGGGGVWWWWWWWWWSRPRLLSSSSWPLVVVVLSVVRRCPSLSVVVRHPSLSVVVRHPSLSVVRRLLLSVVVVVRSRSFSSALPSLLVLRFACASLDPGSRSPPSLVTAGSSSSSSPHCRRPPCCPRRRHPSLLSPVVVVTRRWTFPLSGPPVRVLPLLVHLLVPRDCVHRPLRLFSPLGRVHPSMPPLSSVWRSIL